MTFDPTKPVQTRDGRKARIICTDANGPYPIIALIDEEEHIRSFTNEGKYLQDNNSDNDLINIPEKRVMWVNVYDYVVLQYSTKSMADFCAVENRIACVRVEYEVGEGL